MGGRTKTFRTDDFVRIYEKQYGYGELPWQQARTALRVCVSISASVYDTIRPVVPEFFHCCSRNDSLHRSLRGGGSF